MNEEWTSETERVVRLLREAGLRAAAAANECAEAAKRVAEAMEELGHD